MTLLSFLLWTTPSPGCRASFQSFATQSGDSFLHLFTPRLCKVTDGSDMRQVNRENPARGESSRPTPRKQAASYQSAIRRVMRRRE
jgi:hypothetical protein